MGERIPLLLDTDIGTDIDDALCLAYLLAEPRCELLGVSTVTGQAGERAMLADAVCRAAGRSEVPIWSGTEAPLLAKQGQPEAQQAEVLSRWPHREGFPPCEAVQRMREVILARPGEVTLLTVGPLTNVALLFALDREVPRLLKGLVMMAGRFFGGRTSEWNASCDSHATAIVMAAQVGRVRIHGLDVTLECSMPAQACRRRLKGGALDVVADMAEVWFRQRDRIAFHDPLAAVCTFEPGLCAYRRGRVRVETCDARALGTTVLEESPGGAHAVAESVDSERFFELYFAAVRPGGG